MQSALRCRRRQSWSRRACFVVAGGGWPQWALLARLVPPLLPLRRLIRPLSRLVRRPLLGLLEVVVVVVYPGGQGVGQSWTSLSQRSLSWVCVAQLARLLVDTSEQADRCLSLIS